MMCEHEFVNDIGFFCKHCYKTMQEVDFEQRLAAAKTELAAEKTDHEKAESELLNQVTKINALMLAERREREQAEAQCAYWENKCKELENGR